MSELAADGIPVAVSLRVLKLSRQPYYRWRNQQVTESELLEAYRANALLDAHLDDPEFGYRFLVGEAAEAGEEMCERTAWRICRDNQWWSVYGKKRGKIGKRPGPLDHDDLVTRAATADDVNELWLTDITEHWTDEGELYLCAIEDVFSGRIVGYSALEICLGTGELHPQVEYCLDRGQQVRDRGVGGGSEIDRHLLTGACFHLLRGDAEGRDRLVADPVGAREVCRMTTQQVGRRADPLPFEGAGGKAPEGDLRAELLHVGLSQQLLGPSTDGCTSRVVGGSGRAHVITESGCVLVAQGFT